LEGSLESRLNGFISTRRPGVTEFVSDGLIAFSLSAKLELLSRAGDKREHRTVTLPDYQGVGIGHALWTHIAALWKALGFRATSTTTHPAFIAARRRDLNWVMTRNQSLAASDERFIRHA
jgi:GNAT superfamily N-acetyltransferase